MTPYETAVLQALNKIVENTTPIPKELISKVVEDLFSRSKEDYKKQIEGLGSSASNSTHVTDRIKETFLSPQPTGVFYTSVVDDNTDFEMLICNVLMSDGTIRVGECGHSLGNARSSWFEKVKVRAFQDAMSEKGKILQRLPVPIITE